MFKKIFFLCATAVFLVVPLSGVYAIGDNSLPPEKNPLCWSRDDCVNSRKEIVSEGIAAQGWVQEGECIGDWGKCLSGGTTKTEISLNPSNHQAYSLKSFEFSK